MTLEPIYNEVGEVIAVRDSETGTQADRPPSSFVLPPEVEPFGLHEKRDWIAAQRRLVSPKWCDWEDAGLINASLLEPRK